MFQAQMAIEKPLWNKKDNCSFISILISPPPPHNLFTVFFILHLFLTFFSCHRIRHKKVSATCVANTFFYYCFITISSLSQSLDIFSLASLLTVSIMLLFWQHTNHRTDVFCVVFFFFCNTKRYLLTQWAFIYTCMYLQKQNCKK